MAALDPGALVTDTRRTVREVTLFYEMTAANWSTVLAVHQELLHERKIPLWRALPL